jgi:DNA-binding transcriptional LysR family regulator
VRPDEDGGGVPLSHTVALQRRWAAAHPDVSLHLLRTNTPTGGLAEGGCDIAVVRSPSGPDRLDARRFDSAVVGLEARYCAFAADDRLAWRRQLRLAELADRVLAVDPRTGSSALLLWRAVPRLRTLVVPIARMLRVIRSGPGHLAPYGRGRVGITTEYCGCADSRPQLERTADPTKPSRRVPAQPSCGPDSSRQGDDRIVAATHDIPPARM